MNEFEKPLLSKKEEKYLKKVQCKIEYCLYCQPYDEGEAVWIYGKRTELDDLFYDLNIPAEHWTNIMEHLVCPYCQHTGFSLGIDVGLKTKFEKEVDAHMDEVYNLYGSQVQEFEDFIEKYPLLAFKNKLAKRIHKELEEKKLPVIEIIGNFFRARKADSSEVLQKDKMLNPPMGKPTEGRFNHAGQSHLYLANTKPTAIKEVLSDEGSHLVWVQEFEILEKVNNILDLSFEWDVLTPSTSTLLLSLKVYNSIGRNDRNKENWRPDYYLTRFIMDCAKSLGYNGIKYNSTKESCDFDVVLFYPEQIKVTQKGSPDIEVWLRD